MEISFIAKQGPSQIRYRAKLINHGIPIQRYVQIKGVLHTISIQVILKMEEREKVLYVSKKMKEKRQETIGQITIDYGTQLRMNRSIQVEGSIADITADMEFRRYLYRGNANVTAQSIKLAIGYNINKLHHKIQAGRTGRHLYPLKQNA